MDHFPRSDERPYRVDSITEQHAFLRAYPSVRGPWEIVSQTFSTRDGGAVDRLRIRAAGAAGVDERDVRFDVASFVGTSGVVRGDGFTTALLDRLMRTAADFARDNAVVHPGSLPRFPVPSSRFPGRIDVPLAVLAVDAGRRGLYAPPLVVTLDYPSGDPYGVGHLPDFDPERWPPPRLGDWPPPGVADLDRARLQGTVSRLSGCVTRLIDVWLGGDDYPQRPDEAIEARTMLERLDAPGMLDVYERLNPAYWTWLALSDRGEASGSGRSAPT